MKIDVRVQKITAGFRATPKKVQEAIEKMLVNGSTDIYLVHVEGLKDPQVTNRAGVIRWFPLIVPHSFRDAVKLLENPELVMRRYGDEKGIELVEGKLVQDGQYFTASTQMMFSEAEVWYVSNKGAEPDHIPTNLRPF